MNGRRLGRAVRVGGALLVWLAVLGGHAAAAEAVREGAGVVVVETGLDSAPARAGIRPGDTLTGWERLPNPPANPCGAHGEIGSWVDWLAVVWEQAPRGTVVVAGVRDGHEMSWTVARGDWTTTVRPQLDPAAAALYAEGASLFREKRVQEGAARWEEAIRRAQAVGDWATECWLGLQRGNALVEARSWERADAAYAAAGAAAGRLRDPMATAVVGLAEGDAWTQQRKYERAAQVYRAQLPVMAEAWGDSLRLALGLVKAADADRLCGDAWYEESERSAAQALALCERLAPGSLEVARVRYSLGLLAYWRVDHPRAVRWWEQALATARELAPESDLTVNVLRWLLDAAQAREDLEQADEYCAEALRISRRRAPSGHLTASLMLYLASIRRMTDELDQAERLAEEALLLAQSLPREPTLFSNAHLLLGNVAACRYDYPTALRHHRQALELAVEVSGESSVESAGRMVNVANALSGMGSWMEANELYEKAWAIMAGLSPDTPDIGGMITIMGINELEAGNPERALERFTQAVAFIEAHNLQGSIKSDSLNGVARSRLLLNDLTGAEAVGRQAADHARRYLPGTQDEAQALWTLGRVYWRQGRPAEALEEYRLALEALEAVLGKVGGSAEVRAGFRSAFAELYRDYVELLLEQGRPADAFHVLERYRAQSFLEMLAMRNLASPGEIPAELEEAWRKLAREADQAQQELAGLPPEAEADGRLEAGRARLGELQAERERLLQRIRSTSPRLATLRRPEPLGAAGARAALDPGTLLLSYSVGEAGSTLFALSPEEGLAVFPLEPGREALEEGVAGLRRLITRGAVQAAAPEKLREESRHLYDLLIRPADAWVERSRRVLILPDGPLHSLPFAALVREPSGDGETGGYLVEWRPLHLAMSATVFAELKRARPDGDQPRDGVVTVLADPAYPAPADGAGYSDARVRELLAQGGVLTPLPSTRVEAEAIGGIFGERARLFLEGEATEERAKAVDRASRIVHFACHGLLNPRVPLNSALALTIPVDPGEERDNGLLQAWEIMERMRLDADLVALSACNTALGQEAGGEGLIGLTRAFQYAGARSVLASLWSVADESTAVLMSHFYAYLERGADRDEALRQAQLDLIRGPVSVPGEADPGRRLDAAQPYFWASFQLFGDWR